MNEKVQCGEYNRIPGLADARVVGPNAACQRPCDSKLSNLFRKTPFRSRVAKTLLPFHYFQKKIKPYGHDDVV